MVHGRPHIVVLGGGFGGVYAVLELARRLRGIKPRPRLTLLSNRNYFFFTPLLHEVATGALGRENLAFPLRELVGSCLDEFCQHTVKGLDLRNQVINTDRGDLTYDYLVVALGSQSCTFDIPGADRYAFPLKTIADAARVRNHIIHTLEHATKERDPVRRAALLTFVIVGGGALGAELAPEVSEMFDEWLALYPGIHRREIQLHLVHAGQRLVESFGLAFHKAASAVLKRYWVHLHLGVRVTEVTPDGVALSSGERLAGCTIIWTAGVEPVPLQFANHNPCDKSKFKVEPTLLVRGCENVFALGDIALLKNADGSSVPATAQAAVQQASVVAENLTRLLRQQPLTPFRYRHKGYTLSLGQWKAVVEIGGLRLGGFLAWLTYRTIYFFKLVGAVNKFRVGLDWFLDLFFKRRSSEL